jgi:hypothetical protein
MNMCVLTDLRRAGGSCNVPKQTCQRRLDRSFGRGIDRPDLHAVAPCLPDAAKDTPALAAQVVLARLF